MKYRPARNKMRVIIGCYTLLFLGTLMLLTPTTAHAETLVADCGNATAVPPAYPTVTAALAAFVDPTAQNRLIINGTCHNEGTAGAPGIRIDGFSRLSIQAGVAGATLSHDSSLPCGSTPTPSPWIGPAVLTIVDAHQLVIEGFGQNVGGPGVNGGRLYIIGGNGISIEDSTVTIRGTTVDGSRSAGIGVGNGSNLSLQGTRSGLNTENVLQNSCGAGLNVSPGSNAGVNGWATIQNNRAGVNAGGRVGITAGPAGGPTILIQNNLSEGANATGGGMLSLSGDVQILNNASETDLTRYPAGMRAGVIAYSQGSVFVGGQVQILNHPGSGIWADLKSIVRLGPPIVISPPPPNLTISGNSDGGVKLTHMSIAQSSSIAVLTGNTPNDASCDNSSMIYGDVTGITNLKCANTDQTKK